MRVDIVKSNVGLVPGELATTTYELPEKTTIHLPRKSSTATKLHELYHAKYSPKLLERYLGKDTWSASQYVGEELRAEEFQRSSRSKNPYVSKETLSYIGDRLVDIGFNPNEVLKGIDIALSREGYEPLSRQERSFIWQYVKDSYKDKR